MMGHMLIPEQVKEKKSKHMKIIISILEVTKQPQWPHVILRLQLYFSKSQATHDGMTYEFTQHVKILKDIILPNYGLVFFAKKILSFERKGQ